MRNFLTTAAFTLTTLAVAVGSASAQRGGRAGHTGGHTGGHPHVGTRLAHPGGGRPARPGHQATRSGYQRHQASRPLLGARGRTVQPARRPLGPHVNRGYVYRGVAHRHGYYDRAWRGYTRRWWYRPGGYYIYWAPADSRWYQWAAVDQVFVPVDTLTTEDLPRDDVADTPPPPPPQ